MNKRQHFSKSLNDAKAGAGEQRTHGPAGPVGQTWDWGGLRSESGANSTRTLSPEGGERSSLRDAHFIGCEEAGGMKLQQGDMLNMQQWPSQDVLPSFAGRSAAPGTTASCASSAKFAYSAGAAAP
ncbi:MAG: hypothetical protein Q8M31_18115 [Beijerinckiaceae bacterium]|nr:hypothetical protein [Beijerinckiaceae bacterium]